MISPLEILVISVLVAATAAMFYGIYRAVVRKRGE